MGEETAGFSSLFSKLCELSFNNEATKGWDIYRRPRYTDHRRKVLKRCLYETLFEELRAPWVGKLVHSQGKSGNLTSSFPKSVLNKFSARAFELRLARKFDDADRLDYFLTQWRSLQEPANHVVDFDRTLGNTIVGCEAVLRFLEVLTDSGTRHAAPVLGHQNDFWAKEQRQIKKMPLPEGPLLITDSQLLWRQSLESRHYVHYGRELFECPPILSVPGQGTIRQEQSGLEVFEAVPGTFPGKAKFFAINTTDEDMHEKESRVSVFNALVHGRTNDLQVKLSMPELPNGSKSFHTLALEQRESMDDEGFESLETSSNSSTASDQATNAKENEDIWSMALALPTQKFFTWEMEGRRDKLDERPYLSEAGPEVFDELYNTVICHVSYIVKLPKPNLMMVPLRTLIKDSVNVLIGVPSRTFHLDKVLQSFSVTDRVRLTGVSPEMLNCILSKLAAIGTDYIQLNMFATHHRGQQAGQVLQAFLGALQGYLQCYRTTVLSVEVSVVQSPLQLTFAFEDLGKQLRFLANVCMCSQAFKKAPSDPKVKFPTGVKLLTYLYQLCMEHFGSSKFYPILLSLLKHSATPYIMFVQTWVFKGVCSDMFGEFMIEMDEQYLAFRDKYFWTHGFVMVGRDKLDCVPLFLGELADDMFVCGKAINLLKLCCPGHYLCDPGILLPKMEVTFSMKRLSRIEKECEKYMAEIHKMGAQLQEQREKQRAATEDEKQRAILEERQKAEEAVAEITALIQKAQDAVQQKKREDLLMLKEQMEKAFEHKALVKAQEKEADAELMMKIKEREVTNASIEDEIRKKAREDLVKYYEELGREIEHREARAQWTIRRRLLDTTRAQFLAQEEARLESLREQMSQASRAENVCEVNERPALERHGGLPVVTAGPPVAGVKDETAMTPVSVPSPSLVSLIASGVRTDAMLRAERRNSADRVSDAVIAPDVSDSASGSVMGQGAEERKHTATSLERSPEDTATERKPRKIWEDPQQSAAQLEKLKEEGSGRKTWESTPSGELKIASPVPKSHPSDSSIQFTMYSDKKRNSESPQTPDSTVFRNQEGTKLNSPQLDDSSVQSSATEPSNVVTQPSPSDLVGLVASHPSSSTIQDFLYGAASTISESRTTPSQGHPSDSSAQQLLYTDGTDRGITIGSHTPEHGHPSDSSLSDLLYPTNMATPLSGGRASPYGHPSDSQVALSGDGLNVAQVLLHKSRSTWQHPSDASVQKLLTDISILEESQKTTRGTPPPSQAQNMLYPGLDESSPAVISQTRGTPPPSVAQDIMYPSEEGPAQVLTTHQTRGIPPPSVIQDIMYPSGERVVAPKAASRGHEPAVKITKIMYYLRDQEEKTEVEETPKHLEFEDVWSASLVEPLRDNFDVLDEKPLANLLDSAMSSFPVTQGGSDDGDVDIDAAQLMSLPVLLQRSVMAPLLAQISLVNSAIVTYFVEDLQIKRHFDLFKKLLFMEDGEFALSLSNQLFEKIASGVSPQEMCNPTVMNSIVNKALQLSVYSDSTEHAHNLAFALKSLPEMFKQNEIGTLDFLELRYKVDWPLNIVITEKSVVKYNKIFSFMLRLKRLSWVLRDIWFHLKHIACVSNAAGSPQLRQLQLFRHEMQHFVHNLQGYLSNQILNVTWSEFQERLLTVGSLDDLHNQHSEYLRKAIFRSLLSRKAAPVMTIISDLCTLILKLRTQLLSSSWQQDPSTGHITHPAFDVMCKTHKAFKEYAGFLFTVVSKLVRRGYQSHLDDFLLRINFNNFYIVE